MNFVLDNSFLVSGLVPDEAHADTESLFEMFEKEKHKIYVPAVFWPEYLNVMLNALKKNRITINHLENFSAIINGFNITVYIPSNDLNWHIQKVLPLAQKYKLTAYDASYLAVALETKATLATFDKALMTAAKAAKIPLFI